MHGCAKVWWDRGPGSAGPVGSAASAQLCHCGLRALGTRSRELSPDRTAPMLPGTMASLSSTLYSFDVFQLFKNRDAFSAQQIETGGWLRIVCPGVDDHSHGGAGQKVRSTDALSFGLTSLAVSWAPEYVRRKCTVTHL